LAADLEVCRDAALAEALAGACGLDLGNPLQLGFTAQVRLELGKDAEHVEEALAGGRARCRSAARSP
jgi:hypothetical protein